MNEKNSLGLDKCFLELDNPILLFTEWYNEAKKTEINNILKIFIFVMQRNNKIDIIVALCWRLVVICE